MLQLSLCNNKTHSSTARLGDCGRLTQDTSYRRRAGASAATTTSPPTMTATATTAGHIWLNSLFPIVTFQRMTASSFPVFLRLDFLQPIFPITPLPRDSATAPTQNHQMMTTRYQPVSQTVRPSDAFFRLSFLTILPSAFASTYGFTAVQNCSCLVSSVVDRCPGEVELCSPSDMHFVSCAQRGFEGP